ncbi:hypothetical protein K8640_27260 [Myxococcus sp. XM-1-1-1]|uniref:hypothetical protein n=1 Tax=Myxococcus sp. XM-1-1-1 TaxID=2874602 RepID=UPI001CC0815E|nr:hypothetical protein [Myxococcus sp. XM-1-1-1]MBZ4411921.1 hypothetical protein [Myxococcus sp. XM-1-1-1]
MTKERLTLNIQNTTHNKLEIILEPWTGQYFLHPGEAFDVVAEGDIALPLGIEIAENRVSITCFDTVDSDMYVLRNGKREG